MKPSTQPPEIAIIGRPNVGKSTLFNRIVGRRQAIVGKLSGLTRDRHRGTSEWRGRSFVVVDTGGLEWQSEDEILSQIQEQALEAVGTASLVLFVVDGLTGPAAIEAELARELRRRSVPVFLVVNKCDDDVSAPVKAAEFHALGIDPVFTISAEHGRGVGDLLDAVLDALPDAPEAGDEPEPMLRIAVVGRPNVGKSSLVNALLGHDRVVVSERAGTTRDAIDSVLEHDGREYLLIDTAGIRRTTRREGHAESVSVTIARRRMADADVALLVVDAGVGLSRQDVTIAAEAGECGCGLIVVVNKWDLFEGQPRPQASWFDELQRRMGRIGFAEFAFTSALEGSGVLDLLPLVDEVQARRLQRVPTGELNAMFEHLQRYGPQPPPGAPTLKYITQVGVAPPRFVVFVGGRKGPMPDSYQRYLENRLRGAFDFSGTPIFVRVRRGSRRSG